jgi:hypothetical protein
LPYTAALLLASLSSSILIRWIAPKSLIQIALSLMVVGLFTLAYRVNPQMTSTTLIFPLALYGIAAGLAAVIGAVLIASSWSGVVSGIAEKAEWRMNPDALQQAAIQLEDAERTWTPEDERASIAELPVEVQKSIEQVVKKADTEVLKDALLAIFGVVLVALLVSVFMSAPSEASE